MTVSQSVSDPLTKVRYRAARAAKNKDLDKNIDFHFLDLMVTFYAFDFNSYDCSPDEVNGGYGVVP